jgi:AraC family transcriptional regulator, transcriptional activator of pobA
MVYVVSMDQHKGASWYEEADGSSGIWKLVFMSYGKCMYRLGQEKLLLSKGDLLLLPATTPFYGKSIPTMAHEKYVVRFELRAPLTLPMLASTTHLYWKTGKFELLQERLRALYTESTSSESYGETMCSAILMELLTVCNRELDRLREQPASVKHRHTELMKTYIQNHYREKVTKDDLAAVIDKSPNHAAAVFRKITGQTIGEFTYMLRIKTAISLLQHSQMTVQDISDYLGFCDSSYFHRVFKRHTGQIPSFFMKERETPLS